ncbi:sucrase ferredoxin [Vreelandella sp. EE7]
MKQTFCADLSREQSDPLAGSAAHAERNLLLSWPRAKWQRNLRHASDMSDTLVEMLDQMAGNGRRVNLIHRQGQDATRHTVFLMPERQRFSVARDELTLFLAAWQNADSLERWEQAPPVHDLILCCTHGKKDKCCAKYGYKTFKALAHTVAEHHLPFDVWESSHLGGCRLAASVILLPNARKYGRITPEQTLDFLQTEANGLRFLPGYRGGSQLTPAQQSAELALLERLSTQASQPQLTLLDESGGEHERTLRWRCEQQGAQSEAQVHCQATPLMRVDSCADLDQGPTESLVWRATHLDGQALQA